MDQLGPRLSPADEVIVGTYRRVLAIVGVIGLLTVVMQGAGLPGARALVLPVLMAVGSGVCLWTRRALARPRAATYRGTVGGLVGVITALVLSGVLHGDLVSPLIIAAIWAGPLRALRLPAVRRALSGDENPRGGLRRRVREARQRLAALTRPALRPVPSFG